MRFEYDDGGRKAAGYKGTAKDCVCRAIAIATGNPYAKIYDMLNAYAAKERGRGSFKRRSSARTGVYKETINKVMDALGWVWHPCMKIGQGCTTHLDADELPKGRLIVRVSKHLCAVIDGVLHDTHDCTRGGNRCVYGYFTPDAPQAVQEREQASRDTTTPAERQTRHRTHIARYDAYGWRIMTAAQIRRVAESFIPAELRPYYTGMDIQKSYAGPMTADNCDLYLYFKKPVLTGIAEVRYIHCDLITLDQELDACFIDEVSDDDEECADYDEEYGNRRVVEIKGSPVWQTAERKAVKATWKHSKALSQTHAA